MGAPVAGPFAAGAALGLARRVGWAEGGRGLAIVAALCRQWHYFPLSRSGKLVSAELTVPPGLLNGAGLPQRSRSAPVTAVSRDDFVRGPALLRRIHQRLKDL